VASGIAAAALLVKYFHHQSETISNFFQIDKYEATITTFHQCERHRSMNKENSITIKGNPLISRCYETAEIQGRRNYMEDTNAMLLAENYLLFGVYDGHGGSRASAYAKKFLLQYIDNHFKTKLSQQPFENDTSSVLRSSMVDAFLQLDKEFLIMAETDQMDDGSTALVVAITNSHVIVANAGDCRAVMCRRECAMDLSVDHKANNVQERKRITELNGTVTNIGGVWRVGGVLAVSRAIGDKDLKRWVIAEPEVTSIEKGPEDSFLVIASDGLWDVFTSEEVSSFVSMHLKERQSFENIAKYLVDSAYLKGSMDNITVVIVEL